MSVWGSIKNGVSNLGDTFGLGSPAKMPNAPGVDMAALSYGGDPNMAKNIYGQANATSQGIMGTQAQQFQGQQADYTNAQNALANSSQTLSYGQQQANDAQRQLMIRLSQEAQGRGGPSAAQLAMRGQSEDAMRQQLAMANTSGNPAAMIAAQNNNVNAQNTLTQQIGVQRAQEQQAALQNLAGVASQNQQAMQNTAQQQAAMGQLQAGMSQYNTTNLQNALQANQAAAVNQNAANYSGALGFYNAGLGALNNQAQLNEQGQGLLQQQYGTQADLYKAQREANSKGITSLMSAAGGALSMLSDRRVKKDIEPGGSDISDMFRGASASSYAYKDPAMGEASRHYGPMAQDLAKTEAGRSALIQTPAGLAVNTGRLALANASETGKLRREMDKLHAALRAGAR